MRPSSAAASACTATTSRSSIWSGLLEPRRRGEDLRRSGRPHAGPDRRPRGVRQPGVRRQHDRHQRQQAAAGLQLEPHAQPEAAVVDERRGRLRREQPGRTCSTTTSPTSTRCRSYSMLDNPTGQRERLPAAPGLRRPDRVPPQHVLELPRPADPPEPAAWELQLHGGLHVLEDPRDPGGLRPARSCRACPPSTCSRHGTTSTASSARTAPTWRRCRSAGCSRSSRTTRRSTLFLGGWQFAGVATYVSARRCRRRRTTTSTSRGTNAGGRRRSTPGTSTAPPRSTPFPVLTCDPSKDVPNGYMFNVSLLRGADRRESWQLRHAVHQGQRLQEPGPRRSSRTSRSAARARRLQLRISGYNVLNHATWYPDAGQNLTLHFDERRAEQPELREDQRGQQVRPAHRAARAALHLLGLTTGRSNRAGVAPGGARLFRSGVAVSRGRGAGPIIERSCA